MPILNQTTYHLLRALPEGLVKAVARRYIAGENKQSAIDLALTYREAGFETTLDMLGENVVSPEEALAATDAYINLVETMARTNVSRNISIKLTQLGLRFDERKAHDNLQKILNTAKKYDFFVRLDMEDTSVTDFTLDFYRRARKTWPKVGTVLQARLFRSVADARALAGEGANIRLCKGIYPERPSVAHQRAEPIRGAFLEILETLLRSESYVAIATHDLPLIDRAEQAIAAHRPTLKNLEFQALLGVPIRSRLLSLRKRNITTRIYLPFGRDWYAYSMRRLRENPKIARDVALGLWKRDRFGPAALRDIAG